MNIQAESYGHAVILILEGELTEDSLGALKQAIEHQLSGSSEQPDAATGNADKQVIDLVLNLEKVPFIDSTVLEYLLDLQELLAERLGQVKLVRPDENILKILQITRLDSTFEVFADAPEAVKVMQS